MREEWRGGGGGSRELGTTLGTKLRLVRGTYEFSDGFGGSSAVDIQFKSLALGSRKIVAHAVKVELY